MTSAERVAPATKASTWLIVVALAVSTAVAAIWAANPQQVGIYHDDAFYAVMAKSLAETGEYRIESLPGRPLGTKYPPVYPFLLSMAWRVNPAFPNNVAVLKGVNALAAAVLLVLTFALGRRMGLSEPVALATAAIAASSPGIFGYTDQLMSELVFTNCLLAVLLTAPSRDAPWTWAQAATAAAWASLATLTRTAGVSILIGLALYWWHRRAWRELATAAFVSLGLVGLWMLWVDRNGVAAADPLEYYLSYERGAFGYLTTDPLLAVRLLVTNPAALLAQAHLLLGWSLPVLVFASSILLVVRRGIGVPSTWPAGTGPVTFAYCLVVSAHPYPMARYLSPLLPLVLIVLAKACQSLGHRDEVSPGRWPRRLLWSLAWIPLVAQFLLNMNWVRHLARVTHDGQLVHAEFGATLGSDWQGFEDTSRWIRANTTPDTKLTSWFDTLYYLYTSRQGVRWWPPRPVSYTPLYGRLLAERIDPAVLLRRLDGLGVTLLVIDPYPLAAEHSYATYHLEKLVNMPRTWELAYTSANGRHRIYRRVPPYAVANERALPP